MSLPEYYLSASEYGEWAVMYIKWASQPERPYYLMDEYFAIFHARIAWRKALTDYEARATDPNDRTGHDREDC